MLSTSILYSLLLLGSVAGLPVQDDTTQEGRRVERGDKVAARAISPIYADEAEYKPHGGRNLDDSTISPRDDDLHWSDFTVPGEKRAINPIYADEAEYKPRVSHEKRQLEVTVEEVVEEEWKSWIAPSAINPIYLNVSHSDVYKRADSGPIYGSSGKPNIQDVHQTTNPSCGFASVMAAVANANPDWIGTHVTYAPSLSDASSARISMYDDSLNPRDFDITCGETAEKSDVDASTGVWWPGAYDHAGVKLGLPNADGAMGPILPATSLQAITGKKATGTDKIDADAIFNLALKSASSQTPTILQTKGDGVSTLVGNHAYALLSGDGSGSDRTVTLYNPWGSYVTINVDTIVPETLYLWYLENYDSFSGGSGGGPANGGGGVQTTPDPTPTTDGNVVWVTEVVTVYVNA